MNSLEIAARNYVANICGIGPDLVDLMFTSHPDLAQQANEMVANALNGPFGTLNVGDDGYVKALQETIDHIDSIVMRVDCEHAAKAVHGALAGLKRDIADRIEEVTRVEEVPDISDVVGLLKSLGFNVVAA